MNTRQRFFPVFVLLSITACAAAQQALHVHPAEIQLDGPSDRHDLIVQTIDAAGITRDVTAESQFTLAAPIANVSGATVAPTADGDTTLTIAHAAGSATIPLRVRNFAQSQPLTFANHVLPQLTKAGCNNGSCHGSARGQDGFHLSLFGYDPAGDYGRITRELPGRRVNLALPAASLLLTKATGAVPHTGGTRFAADSSAHRVILEWLRAGAAPDPAELRRANAIELYPVALVLQPGDLHRLGVRARFSDGSDSDVTPLAVYITGNDAAARVDDAGRVSAVAPGVATILARFDAYSVAAEVIVVPPGPPIDAGPAPAATYVDAPINERLFKLRLRPAPLCSDEEFLRRACIDLIGLLPTADQRERYLAAPQAERRARLVDELLARKEFIELWVMKWAERLQVRSTQQVSYKAMLLYHGWLQERLTAGVPFDQIVRELLTADGGSFSNPATNFFHAEPDALKLAENVAQAFLGVRIQCAQCHNHPFDRWTMDDYYGFAAFFAQIGRKPGEDARETILFRGGGEVTHPLRNAAMPPRVFDGPTPALENRDRRTALAEWLTAPSNRAFSRNVANFVWAHFFGRGIVEPADDARVSNPPSNPVLLDALAERLVAANFDLRSLARDICNSHAYQRSTRSDDPACGGPDVFARAAVRRIRAETLLDCVSQVTGAPEKFPGLPVGARAVQIADGNTSNYFLSTFGRASRATVCTCEVVMEPNLSQALHLINGDTLARKIREGGRIARWLASGLNPEQIAERIYFDCLGRAPHASELEQLRPLLASDPPAALEDLFWATLNSQEFLFTH